MIDPFMESVERRRKERKRMFSEMKKTCLHSFHKPQKLTQSIGKSKGIIRKMRRPNLSVGIKPMRDEAQIASNL